MTLFRIAIKGTFDKTDLELVDQLSEAGVIPPGVYTTQITVSMAATSH